MLFYLLLYKCVLEYWWIIPVEKTLNKWWLLNNIKVKYVYNTHKLKFRRNKTCPLELVKDNSHLYQSSEEKK